MAGNFLHKHKQTLLYSISLAGLLFLLKWLELRFIIIDHSFEIYIGLIACLFTGLGIWLALKLTKPKVEKVIVEKEVFIPVQADFEQDETACAEMSLSKREIEVLQLMAEGLSNQEIAARLFVSLNTIKTHTSRVFEKMEVKRRTQAVEKARRMSIIK